MRSVIAVPWRVAFLLFLGMNEYTVLRVRFATDALTIFLHYWKGGVDKIR